MKKFAGKREELAERKVVSNKTLKPSPDRRSFFIMTAAFTAVYVIWGSTYLAIKFAIETIPTFLMAGVRFSIAVGILYGIARLHRVRKTQAHHWRTSLIVGALLLGIGNGGRHHLCICKSRNRRATRLGHRGESLTAQMLVGAAIIVGSVALITLSKKAFKRSSRRNRGSADRMRQGW